MAPERFENRMIQSSTAPLLNHPHGFRESRRFFSPFQISYLLLLEQKLDVSDSCQKTTQVGARLAFQYKHGHKSVVLSKALKRGAQGLQKRGIC